MSVRVCAMQLRDRSQRVSPVLRRRFAGPTRSPSTAGCGSQRSCRLGASALPTGFVAALRQAIRGDASARLIGAGDVPDPPGQDTSGRFALSAWLAQAEREHDIVLCLADGELSEWSRTAVRGADQVVLVAGDGDGDATLNPVERFAFEMIPPARRRLLRLHKKRSGIVPPGKAWLGERDVFMIHNAVEDDAADVARLLRFLRGVAIGYVAGGGGGFGPAHVGIVRALPRCRRSLRHVRRRQRRRSDLRAFCDPVRTRGAAGKNRRHVSAAAEHCPNTRIRVTGLFDHKPLDDCLRAGYGDSAIEDAWLPWFAVALDISSYEKRIIRRGPFWQAIRASVSIPGALPPYFDADGHMLLDGGLVDNLPVEPMKTLKTGPNVVVDLRPRQTRTYDIDYADIPGRRELLLRLGNPFARGGLPRCPGPATVIQLSMFGGLDEPYTGRSCERSVAEAATVRRRASARLEPPQTGLRSRLSMGGAMPGGARQKRRSGLCSAAARRNSRRLRRFLKFPGVAFGVLDEELRRADQAADLLIGDAERVHTGAERRRVSDQPGRMPPRRLDAGFGSRFHRRVVGDQVELHPFLLVGQPGAFAHFVERRRARNDLQPQHVTVKGDARVKPFGGDGNALVDRAEKLKFWEPFWLRRPASLMAFLLRTECRLYPAVLRSRQAALFMVPAAAGHRATDAARRNRG